MFEYATNFTINGLSINSIDGNNSRIAGYHNHGVGTFSDNDPYPPPPEYESLFGSTDSGTTRGDRNSGGTHGPTSTQRFSRDDSGIGGTKRARSTSRGRESSNEDISSDSEDDLSNDQSDSVAFTEFRVDQAGRISSTTSMRPRSSGLDDQSQTYTFTTTRGIGSANGQSSILSQPPNLGSLRHIVESAISTANSFGWNENGEVTTRHDTRGAANGRQQNSGNGRQIYRQRGPCVNISVRNGRSVISSSGGTIMTGPNGTSNLEGQYANISVGNGNSMQFASAQSTVHASRNQVGSRGSASSCIASDSSDKNWASKCWPFRRSQNKRDK